MPTHEHPPVDSDPRREPNDLGARYGRIGIAAVAAAARYAGAGRNETVAAPVRDRPPTMNEVLLLG